MTPAEFAKLTAAGKIRFQPPESSLVTSASSVITIPSSIGASPLTGLTGTQTEIDGDVCTGIFVCIKTDNNEIIMKNQMSNSEHVYFIT